MTPENLTEAAAILVARRRSGQQGERLPSHCRPYTLVDALALQDEVAHQWCVQMDDTIGAWKCSLPPQDKVIIAPIFTRTIDSVAPVSVWPKGDKARIEPELAFYFGVDLAPRAQPYSRAEIDAAVVRTHLALELINSRYRDPASCEFAEVLADGLVNQGLFIGPQVDGVSAQAARSLTLSIRCEGDEPRVLEGIHPNNEPRAPLYWLVEFLRSRGQGIVAGQAVITGSYAGVIEVPLNTPVDIVYGDLGKLQVSFSAKTST